MPFDSTLTNKVSSVVEQQLPDFIKSEHPIFVNFLETYYKQENIDILVNLFDAYHYTPEYNYPRTINNITVTHHGMGSIKNYSSFIGLNRKNKGWQCGIVLP